MLVGSSALLPLAAIILASAPSALADCNSYGIDIVNGGNYFINTLSTDDFTSVTQWSGMFDPILPISQ